MYTASLQIQHDCMLGRISRELPDLQIARWSVSARDLYQVRGPHDQVAALRRSIDRMFGILHHTEVARGVLFITQRDCFDPEGHAFFTGTVRTRLWDVPPVTYAAGWEGWRVISRGRSPLRDAVESMRKFGDVKIASVGAADSVQITSMMLIPASEILADLTPRQVSALLLGVDRGYYSIPGETNMATLASEVGLSQSTFGEHLRKAEARVLSNLRPYLRSFDVNQSMDTMPSAQDVGHAERNRFRKRN